MADNIDDQLNALADEFLNPADAVQADVQEDPVEAKIKEGESFWDTIRNYSPTAVVDSGTPAGKVTQQAGIGLMEAVQGTANFVIDSVDTIENALAEYGVGPGDLVTEEDQIRFIEKNFPNPTTKAQAGARMVARYMLPFGAIGMISKGSKLAKTVKGVAGASLISAATIDPEDERLADVMNEVPVLNKLVPEFLLSEEDDSRFESRIKNAVESVFVDAGMLGAGSMAKGFWSSMKAMKDSRRAYKKVMEETAEKAATRKEVPENMAEFSQAKVDEHLAAGVEGKTIKQIQSEAKKQGRPLSQEELFIIAKRGVVKDEEAGKMAANIVKNREKMKSMIDAEIPNTVTVEERLALQNEMEGALVEALSKLPKDIAKASAEEKAIAREALEHLDAIFASAKSGSSEAARTLRIERIIKESGGANARILDEYSRLKGGTEDTDALLLAFQQAIENADAAEAAIKMAQTTGKSKTDALVEFWYNNTLSGPQTHVVNIVSNSFNPIGSIVESAIQEVLDLGHFGASKISSTIRGGEVHKIETLGQTQAFAHGLLSGMYEGLVNAKAVVKGQTPQGSVKLPQLKKQNISAETFGFDKGSPAGQMIEEMGKMINVPGRFLLAQDAFFRTINYRAKVHQMAYRQAKKSKDFGKEYQALIKNPSETISMGANKFAEEQIFARPMRGPNLPNGQRAKSELFLGDLQAGIEETMKNHIPLGLGNILFPFMRVSANLTDYTLQRLPGFSALTPRFRSDMAAGGLRRKEALSKVAVGSSVLALGGMFHYGGILQGEGPRDRKLKKAMGWKENTINGVNLASLGPYGTILKVSADLMDMKANIDLEDEFPMQDLMAGAVMMTADLMTPEVLGENLPTIFGMISDLGDGRINEKQISQQVARLTSGFIPFSAGIRQTGRLFDTTKKDLSPMEQYDLGTQIWERTKNEWLATMGLDDAPPQRNLFGEPVHYPSGLIPSFASSVYGEPQDDPLIQEIVRLEMDGKVLKNSARIENRHTSISMPQRDLTKGFAGQQFPVKLNPKQYDRYVQLAAGIGLGPGVPTLKERLNEFINEDAYKLMPDERRKLAIKEVISQYRSAAGQKMRGEETIRQRFERIGRKRLEVLSGE